ncbi:MAG: hypothetical protein DDT40_00941 [candidate division WS2 bacterium]|nr:hypothetical protein [Candidatus Psychracetigena formicireducens]
MISPKKIAMLEEMMEMNEGELNLEMELSELENWNSMAKLSLIVLMNDEFGKELSGEQIRSFVIVKDILDFME